VITSQKKREKANPILTQGLALLKHMSKPTKDNHGSKDHLSSNDTIVSKQLITKPILAIRKENLDNMRKNS
jgi:hypothetical protein